MRVRYQSQPHFKLDEWRIIEEEVREENNRFHETIFSLGNGYMGVRGTFEEGFSGDGKNTSRETYLNGIYDYQKYHYMWKRPGFPDATHAMLNVTDWLIINLYIDGERFDLSRGTIGNYQRFLDLKQGLLIRELDWTSPSGKKAHIKIERFISLDNLHTAAIRYSLRPINFGGNLSFVSELNGNVRNANIKDQALHVVDRGFSENVGFLTHRTATSGFTISCAMVNNLRSDDKGFTYERKPVPGEKAVKEELSFQAGQGENYTLCKFINFYTSRDVEENVVQEKAVRGVTAAAEVGFQGLFKNHSEIWRDFWERADVIIKGDPLCQQSIRFDMFHLMQSCGKDGETNIGANGLTGNLYQGHVFWDTEIYILPFFLQNYPGIAKSLLMYRYNILDKARERARQMDDKGALFSWNTINGEECGWVFEAATAQYHINCAVAYAIFKYVEATDDETFLVDFGAEILFETSRCLANRGHFIPLRDNKFCINVICGPDEYTPAVDNNCYTNTMTRFHLNFALDVAKMMKDRYPEKYKELAGKIGLREEEQALWKRAADNMYIPFNEKLNIHPQDDSYLYRDPIDLDKIPPEKMPSMSNLHPLNLWRLQASKQADVLLLMFLRGHEFSLEIKKSNYDFYEPRTIHDSSLSPSIFSIMAGEVGYYRQAYDYFLYSCRMDLDNLKGTTQFGAHAACMGGTWMSIIYGFAGMRTYENTLHFNPYLPEKWTGYEFKINFKSRLLKISVDKEEARYELMKGSAIKLYSGKERIALSPDKPVISCKVKS